MNDDTHIHASRPTNAAQLNPTSFDVTERVSREQIRREIIRLFRSTDLSPREILLRLKEHFHAAPISEHDRRMFLRHVTIWVRDEALIRGAAEPMKPNPHANLLKAFQYLDRADPDGARILELAYVAELAPAQIADVLELATEAVAAKLQIIQTWLRRVAAGEPHESYQTELALRAPRGH
jgi:DNA-directed RNA polymerase specialized sigma24 family protein